LLELGRILLNGYLVVLSVLLTSRLICAGNWGLSRTSFEASIPYGSNSHDLAPKLRATMREIAPLIGYL